MKGIISIQPPFMFMEEQGPAPSQKLYPLLMLRTAFGSRDNSLKACLSDTVLTHMVHPLMICKQVILIDSI